MASTAPITGSLPGKIRTFLLDHERLLIVIVVAALLFWGYGKYADIRANEADKTLQAQKLVTAAQVQANAQLAQTVADDKLALQQLTDKLSAQNQQLANANIALATALSQRQKTDATLPPTELAQRWAQITPNMPAGGVVLSPDNSMKVTQAGAVATVVELEKVKPLTDELANETQAKTNVDLLLVSANKSIFDLNGQVAGAVKLDGDHQKQCSDEKDQMKAQFRKSKRRWFIIGYVAGFISRQVIKSYTGL